MYGVQKAREAAAAVSRREALRCLTVDRRVLTRRRRGAEDKGEGIGGRRARPGLDPGGIHTWPGPAAGGHVSSGAAASSCAARRVHKMSLPANVRTSVSGRLRRRKTRTRRRQEQRARKRTVGGRRAPEHRPPTHSPTRRPQRRHHHQPPYSAPPRQTAPTTASCLASPASSSRHPLS